MELALDVVVQAELHVVAEVVEAELVVGSVGDVAAIGVAPFDGAEVEEAVVLRDVRQVELEARVVDDRGHGEAEERVDRSHPLHVAAGEVVVDGDQVRALAAERVQVERERGDEGLPLARLHLGDAALVQHDPAEQLDVKVTEADGPPRRFADGGERLREDLLQDGGRVLVAGLREAFPEARGLLGEGRVRQRAEALLEAVDLLDDRAQPAQRALVRAAEKARQEPWHQERIILVTGLGDVKPNGRYGPRNRSGCRGSGRRCG